ncbi:DUF5680 domain-containing protein [Deinococcus misasensis]|uniref:DUF5680 domain-containing protein n=1 Tax=Deinococcus misasensis TaxID=392413 RepID=UPI0005573BD4|nr:DUF5680 domain-containing protein [Deinococcus misasensis]
MTYMNLETFIVEAKAHTYVGNSRKSLSYRPSSQDLQHHNGDFSYLDSCFGGRDFIGQEVVYHRKNPLWAMNYYGRIIKPDLITPAEVSTILKVALSEQYQEGRFLGGFKCHHLWGLYIDTNSGGHECFTGYEWIEVQGVKAYELHYHGGLIRQE